jgi:hypothetical protein
LTRAKRKKVTIQAVAERAGVSAMTVSNVFNCNAPICFANTLEGNLITHHPGSQPGPDAGGTLARRGIPARGATVGT